MYLSFFKKEKRISREDVVNYLINNADSNTIVFANKFLDNDFVLTQYKTECMGFVDYTVHHIPRGRFKISGSIQSNILEINDIECFENNKGYGSLLMDEIKSFVKENGVLEIRG